MFSLYKSSKVFVCLYVRVTLITRPIWFSFAVMLLVGPGKILNYFGPIPLPSLKCLLEAFRGESASKSN